MNKLMAFLFTCCALLFLAACPKPEIKQKPPEGQACGGFPSILCPDGQYCNFPAAANCGSIDAIGICQPKPQECPALVNPVCGCDRTTYENACGAAKAGKSVKYEGQCKQICGGRLQIRCPDGQECLDDPGDHCNPTQGGVDCSGICKKE
ncbi:hypothetical protein [Candidatus Electronema sp. PJ]|uniref:hypothetical protein n=1 Tax=Candidatus Electronema sp. PJ TaxID=3401572 RepID=UPI003AA9D087